MKTQCGQSLALVALSALALFGMLLLVINGGALIQARQALAHAVEDAAVAALRTGNVGALGIDPHLADEQARQVLRAELGNAYGLLETPGDIAEAAVVSISSEGVDVSIEASVCPPAWRSCFPMRLKASASLFTSLVLPAEATPVPPLVIPVIAP